jgi:hypothetical protein
MRSNVSVSALLAIFAEKEILPDRISTMIKEATAMFQRIIGETSMKEIIHAQIEGFRYENSKEGGWQEGFPAFLNSLLSGSR